MESWLFQPKAEGSKESVLKEKTYKDVGYETQPVQCGEGQPSLRGSILPSSSVLKRKPEGCMLDQ
jgi:hypothetical protein